MRRANPSLRPAGWFGGPKVLVARLALAFLISRILHALSMLYTTTTMLRAPSMLLQHIGFVVAGGWLVATAL
jgi:MAPEG family